MDINQNNIIRGRLTSPSNADYRSNSISSRTLSVSYHKRIEINNNLLNKEFTEPIDSSQLSYDNSNEQGNPISEATNNSTTTRKQCGTNKTLALNKTPKPQDKDTMNNDSNTSSQDDVINIQILYDPN